MRFSTASRKRRKTTSGNSPPSLAARKAWRRHQPCQCSSHIASRSASIANAAGGNRVLRRAAHALPPSFFTGSRSSWSKGFQFRASHSMSGSKYQWTDSMRSPSSLCAHRFRPSTQIWKLPQDALTSGAVARPSSGSGANANRTAKRLVSPTSLSHWTVIERQSQLRRISLRRTQPASSHCLRIATGTATQPIG